MKNLMELAMSATEENVVKRSRKESVNESLVRILYDDKEKLTRLELIARISLDRLISEHGEDELTTMANENPKQFQELLAKTNKTVKNGLDTSVSNSQNNSSFHYNDKYKNLELKEVAGKFQITDKKPKSDKK